MQVLTLVIGQLFHSSLKMPALNIKICPSIADKILFSNIFNSISTDKHARTSTFSVDTSTVSIDSWTVNNSRFLCYKMMFVCPHSKTNRKRERESDHLTYQIFMHYCTIIPCFGLDTILIQNLILKIGSYPPLGNPIYFIGSLTQNSTVY